MIGPGWLPRYRPRGLAPLSKRMVGYTRRRRAKASNQPVVRTHRDVAGELVTFDHGPSEFPVALARPREARSQLVALVGALQRWLVARWQWLRPRSVPCAVAGLGMMAVLASADYLAHYKEECMKTHAASVVHIEVAPR